MATTTASSANFKNYVLVTLAYWGFTITDGALRMLVLLYFYNIGYTPIQIASLFLFYEVFGVITNFLGGWIGSQLGLKVTLYTGIGLQVFSLVILSFLNPSWAQWLAVPYVMVAQAFSGIAKDLTKIIDTTTTELLFMALFLRLLKKGGRGAVIVPDGVLFGSSKAHKELRRLIVEEQKLDAVVALPSGVFKPYAGVSTAILLFTKTNSGGTDFVWFYDVNADGLSLDDKRSALLSEDKLGAVPQTWLTADEHYKNNLPDVLRRWQLRSTTELDRPRTAQSFCVAKADIESQGYDLSLNRYKEVVHEEVEHVAPRDILSNLAKLEVEIEEGMKELELLLVAKV